MIIIIPKNKVNNIIMTKKRQILYQGYFKIIQSFKILIEKINIENKSKKVNINNEELIKLLKRQKVYLTMDDYLIEKFLDQENICYAHKKICDTCKELNIITLLSDKTTLYHKNKYYCKNCARKYLEKIIETRALSDYNGRFEILLQNFNDLDKIINIFEKDYNPIKNTFLTHYDTIKSTEEDYVKISPDCLDIPYEFKNILKEKISYLMPIQVLAIEKGLLEDENLLIVSATASGKSLIGEIAGITKALNNKKMIYISPLVALANQKYRDFKADYDKLGLKTVIKVGLNRINTEEELYIADECIDDADIIIATYESLDFILRSGEYEVLNDLGVVIIDEVQMLESEQRGHRLNGLINRLINLFPHTQFIALSATINNSEEIAESFGMKLVSYDKRPIDIERHILPVSKKEINEYIALLCKNEFKIISSKNYHGQCLIFTSSRRKTHEISDYLNKKNIPSVAYHAGLTYNKKLQIEEDFINQHISTIVTTSALGSGVDFPASLVIFESLNMGYENITNNEFHQMFGRAGRPSYHDMGKVYLLPLKDNEKECNLAFDLLSSGVDNVNVLYDVDDVYEQILSDVSAFGTCDLHNLKKKYDNYSIAITFDETIHDLFKYKMIDYCSNSEIVKITKYGKAVSKSFINITIAEYIKESLNEDIIKTVINIELIKNVYISQKLINNLLCNGYNVSSNLYSDSIKNIVHEDRILTHLNKNIRNKFINIINDFIVCDCLESPYCNCIERNISEYIINRRLQGWSPLQISQEFRRVYDLLIYAGDIYSYLDQVIRILDSIKRIADVFDVKSTKNECIELIKKIEG